MTPVVDNKRPISPPSMENENKRQNTGPSRGKKSKIGTRKYKVKEADKTSPLGVLNYEIEEILKVHGLQKEEIANDMKRILNDKSVEEKYNREVRDVEVLRLSSSGDGLALLSHPEKPDGKQICIVPFALPGDICVVRVFKSHPFYVEGDLLSVTKPSEHRQDELIKCRYFGKCSGCQYQNVNYQQQLEFKKHTIENAYKYLAPKLSAIKEALPSISNTEPSPLQYEYRTKLTPHFNVPKKKPENYFRPSLGFGAKGRPEWRKEVAGGDHSILDIEDCYIGTPIVNVGMKNERQRFEQEYTKYKKGATILLRENTKVLQKDEPLALDPGSTDSNDQVSHIEVEANEVKLAKTCVTKNRQIVSEYINGYTFEFSAGEFFQNNNSILPKVTSYVKSNLAIPNSKPEDPNYLVDAYCGSGLFSITCSDNVSRVIGVEISADSVSFAKRNAEANNIKNATFIAGKAEELFKNVDTPAERTSVILDPPRKGCDSVFLDQLSDYHPARIVYISCNVHSQARDIDWFINDTARGKDYYVESIKGFDFFPQTHHVESVAVLSLKTNRA